MQLARTLPATWNVPWRTLLTVLPWIGLAWFAWFLGTWGQGGDAEIFYAVDFPPDYSRSNILTPTYNYSPAFAFWIQPFQLLPWPVFHVGIVALEVGALAWMVTPWAALLLVFVQMPYIHAELLEANLFLAAGALTVIGLRYPALFAPLLLSKVTPGVALVWFAVRREWRALGIALGATVLMSIPALLAPESWVAWVHTSLLDNVSSADGRTGIPLIIRVPLAVAVVAWGASTDRPWTVPLAVAFSFPLNGLGWLAGLGLVAQQRRSVTRLPNQSPASAPA